MARLGAAEQRLGGTEAALRGRDAQLLEMRAAASHAQARGDVRRCAEMQGDVGRCGEMQGDMGSSCACAPWMSISGPMTTSR